MCLIVIGYQGAPFCNVAESRERRQLFDVLAAAPLASSTKDGAVATNRGLVELLGRWNSGTLVELRASAVHVVEMASRCVSPVPPPVSVVPCLTDASAPLCDWSWGICSPLSVSFGCG